jgi:uncharacterized RDD family membrane protein YckC
MEMDNLPPYLSQQQSSMEDRRIGFGRRLGAKLLDALIMLIIAIVFYYAAGDDIHNNLDRMVRIIMAQQGQDSAAYSEEFADLMAQVTKLSLIANFVGILVNLTELVLGATPGKMLLSIRVAHANGRKGSIALWAKRWAVVNASTVFSLLALSGTPFFNTLSGLLSFVVFLGCFAVLSQRRQALHDVIAGTAVYYDHDIKEE